MTFSVSFVLTVLIIGVIHSSRPLDSLDPRSNHIPSSVVAFSKSDSTIPISNSNLKSFVQSLSSIYLIFLRWSLW